MRHAVLLVWGLFWLGVPGLALATCFDNPMWRDEPLTQAYIDTLPNEAEFDLHREHLKLVLLAQDVTAATRAEERRQLTTQAILNHSGDRGALRRQLTQSDYAALLSHFDVSRPDTLPRRASGWMMRALWSHGCTSEALRILKHRKETEFASHLLPVAINDLGWILDVITRFEQTHAGNSVVAFAGLRSRTLVALMTSPDKAEAILQDFLVRHDRRDRDMVDPSDLTEMSAKNTLAFVQRQPLPGFGEKGAQDIVVLADFAIWMMAAGECAMARALVRKLLSSSGLRNRHIIEAFSLRCAMSKATST